ncbi:type VI secretion system-associated protein TagF [Roseibium algae]|uniref:Type VI secretion system-associated protein TagF n=1 Tax=Roseibium algae TaxID=3123038 RepID=A0ABU8TFH0_9HYPH
MTGSNTQFGWYGKVPCVGDFIRKGLSPQFISAWDAWMQGILIDGKEALGDRWQACYVSAPIWRFALSAGFCGPRPIAGILMPSVDRVGRQFPLCLAMEDPITEAGATAWTTYQALQPVFPQLEEAALAMLDDKAAITDMEEALAQLPPLNVKMQSRVSRLGSATALVTNGLIEQQIPALATQAPATLWTSAYGGMNRMFFAPEMPQGRELAAGLFDLQAASWQL